MEPVRRDPLTRTMPCTAPIDLALTLGGLAHGPGDPSTRVGRHEFRRAMNTVAGPVTVRVSTDRSAGRVAVEAWGAGAAWLIDRAPAFAGLDDDPGELRTDHPVVAPLARRLAGLRLARAGAVLDVAVGAVIGQRVTFKDAWRSWAALVHRHGTPAPGPTAELRVPPSAEALAALPDAARRGLGLEERRGATLTRVAREAARLERAAESEGLAACLRAIPGVGVWTTTAVVQAVLGDPDVVLLGDLHLPSIVAYALAGEERADDARMLELLEPFRGQRARVVRLLRAGTPGPPRRSPRAVVPDLLRREVRRSGLRTHP